MGVQSVSIDGEDWTPYVTALSITREIGGATSTCSLTVEDSRAKSIRQRAGVIVGGGGGAVLFSGQVARISINQNTRNSNSFKLECRDYTYLLESVVIPEEVFTSDSDQAIITYLFGQYLTAINTSEVQHVADVSSLEIREETMLSALRKITDRSGAEFFIDPSLKLQYYNPATRTAPFGLSDQPDYVSTFPILRDGFRFSEDFATPANRITVVGSRLVETNAWRNFTPPSAGDAGGIGRSGTQWPPGGGFYSTPLRIEATYNGNGLVFLLGVGLVRFDTSAIPSNATIKSATLKLRSSSYVGGQDPNPFRFMFSVEYYDGSQWPIDSGDWTATPSSSAYGTQLLGFISPGAWRSLPLKDPAQNIKKGGWTGFRLHMIDHGAPPAETNYVTLYGQGSDYPPTLEVAYSVLAPAGVSVTHNETASQSLYGVFERTILEETVGTEAEALARAQIEAKRWAYPIREGAVSFERDGVNVGDHLRLELNGLGVDDTFIVNRLRINWDQGKTRYTADLGERRPDLVKYLAALED